MANTFKNFRARVLEIHRARCGIFGPGLLRTHPKSLPLSLSGHAKKDACEKLDGFELMVRTDGTRPLESYLKAAGTWRSSDGT